MPTVLKVATVYTANFGDYDIVQEPKEKHPHAEYLLFSDRVVFLRGWRQIVSSPYLAAVREARKRKCLSHRHTDTEYSIWHDANIRLMTSPIRLCEMLGDSDIMAFSHPYRTCLYDEALACIELGKADREILDRQISMYKTAEYQSQNGLCETGLLVRRHTEALAKFNEAWWAEIETGSHRDQISFNYVAWKTGIKIKTIDGGLKRSPHVEYSGRHNGASKS